MRLVIGLGNPGERYARTRHNVGWLVLDALAARGDARALPPGDGWTAEQVTLRGRELTLLKPQTFMNASGEALAAFRETRPVAGDELLVVTDDVYLPLGALRLRAKGGTGGHRGLESIAAAAGSAEFPRLRLGVGAPEPSAGLREHVLETFDDEERAPLEDMILRGADAVECWATDGLLAAMNRYNRRESAEEQTS